MNAITPRARNRSLATIALTTLIAACAAEAPVAPNALAPGARPDAAALPSKGPNLGSCDSLKVPNGHRASYRAHATGVQIYRWSGSAWTFVAPRADLFADAANAVKVGTHFGGPTWLSNTGSQVVAAAQKRCPVGPNDIPWLLLASTSASTEGIFANTTYIHRVNTVGGIAPAAAGDSVGHVTEVPYTAEYWFYRRQ